MPQDLEPIDFDQLTARRLIARRDLSALVACEPCRSSRPLNPWKIGERLGDLPLKEMKFVCRRCGARATQVDVWRSHVGTSCMVATITLERPKAGYGTGLWIDP